MLPNDYTRCSDGKTLCSRADTCARTEWPKSVQVSVSSFWLHAQYSSDKECGYYIPKENVDNSTSEDKNHE